MRELFETGRIFDIVLLAMAAECVGLLVYRTLTGRGVAVAALIPNVLAGAGLVLATRAMMTGAAWGWVALWLTVALTAHLYDLSQRWAR